MKIAVTGTTEAFEDLKAEQDNIEWIRTEDIGGFKNYPEASAFFNLHDNACQEIYPGELKAVFINSVIVPLKEMGRNENLIRINGWKGFLKRTTWETSGDLNASHRNILDALGKKNVPVADEPGFIAARILAMIINEAWFAKGEGVSTESEIDIAMRLGTNYPKGPFEWANEIGTKKIFSLLEKLEKSDKRYTPAPLFKKELSVRI